MKGRRNLNEEGERIYRFYYLTMNTAYTAEEFEGAEGFEGAIGAEGARGAEVAEGAMGSEEAAKYILLDG